MLLDDNLIAVQDPPGNHNTTCQHWRSLTMSLEISLDLQKVTQHNPVHIVGPRCRVDYLLVKRFEMRVPSPLARLCWRQCWRRSNPDTLFHEISAFYWPCNLIVSVALLISMKIPTFECLRESAPKRILFMKEILHVHKRTGSGPSWTLRPAFNNFSTNMIFCTAPNISANNSPIHIICCTIHLQLLLVNRSSTTRILSVSGFLFCQSIFTFWHCVGRRDWPEILKCSHLAFDHFFSSLFYVHCPSIDCPLDIIFCFLFVAEAAALVEKCHALVHRKVF
mmetsp:Transcript_135297/g.252907  ORF Transcript_135297/g.252907 Transcript_135297/m.252907 type:complete len:279 (-) Transcript_135297:498-1334(-)